MIGLGGGIRSWTLKLKKKLALIFLTGLNPNWTGRGQSWPRQLWPQIAGKLIKYFVYYFLTYSCRNVFRIFLNFWHDLKKWRLNVHFDVFSSEIRPRRPLPNPPLPPGFTVYTDHLSAGKVPPGRGPQSGAAPVINSNQFPVAGRVECGGRRVLSGAGSLALSKWTAGAAPIWGIFRNRRPL
jgi:hypothetical protein